MEVFMKKVFLFLLIFLLSFSLNGSNESSFNKFEKFSMPRMSDSPDSGFILLFTEKGQDLFNSQINVGNYLSFKATRAAAINDYEFFSDVLKSDFYVYEQNKKGKITYKSAVYKYDGHDFFNGYQTNVLNDRAESKNMGIVFAGVKKHNNSNEEYKITTYSASRGFIIPIPIPLNIAFYIKRVSDTKILWSMDDDYTTPDYTFTIESGKVVVRNKKNEIHSTFYRNGDSLFIEYPKKKPEVFEIKVNKELSQFEYYKNGKMTASATYQLVK